MKKYVMEITMAALLLLSFYFLSREAAVASAELKEKQKVIVVDPGHGGMDPGMLGVGRLEEKGINLAIARRVKEQLECRGFQVVMTRESDRGLYEEESPNKKAQDMHRRIALIKEREPLLSVSIHQNSYQDPSVCGPQVFYYEDSVEGKHLAEVLQKKLNIGLSIKRPRTAKGNTSYYLLKQSPGILTIIECGFLTNPEEAGKLQSEEYQEKVAASITEGICAYLKTFSVN